LDHRPTARPLPSVSFSELQPKRRVLLAIVNYISHAPITWERHSITQTKHPLARVERLSNLSAPRTTRLPKTKPRIMKSRLANSRYE
jgi:hypothetical protein